MSEASSTSRAERLAPLVSRALELRDAGRTDWLQAACRRDPGVTEEVRAAVESADALPELLRSGVGHNPLVGRSLGGRFRLLQRIGAGAMGVVYLADDLELHRKVACKVVRQGGMAPAEVLERFAREARAMAAVQHPSVITIYDRGRTDADEVYIVMELVEGAPLGELVDAFAHRKPRERSDDSAWITERFGIGTRGEPSLLRTVVRWIADLAQGLQAVHRAGVLHRDIKPSNVIVRTDGRPTLLDFGIAQLEGLGVITRGVSSVGTPSYLPPEALQRGSSRTAASDVYSLAATLYHLITSHAPYEGTPTQVLAAIASREPVPAARLRPGLPRDLQAILDKGMHRKPGARYQTAAELEADLRAFLEFRPIVARPVGPVARTARRLARSRVAWGAAVALVAIGLLAFGTAWRNARADARRERFWELYATLPPNFTVVEPQNRVVISDADRGALEVLLDQLLAVSDDPVTIRLLRGSFRFDHGDVAGAAEDIAAVSEEVSALFGAALRARYAARSGSAPTPLPEPTTAREVYIAAYEASRDGDFNRVRALLADPRVRAIAHAEEMRLALTRVEVKDPVQRQRLALEAYSDVLRLEHQLGRRTATTRHLIGRLLPSLQRYSDALEACEEGIKLAPRSHVIRINAGYSAMRLGELDRAAEHLEVACELKPSYAKPVETLVWVHIQDGAFDAALARVTDAAPRLVPRDDTWQDYWAGVIHTYAALSLRASDGPDAARERASTAQQHFERAARAGKDLEGDTAGKLASALAANDASALLSTLLALVTAEPTNLWRLGLLLDHFPSRLANSHSSGLRALLSALRSALGGSAVDTSGSR